MTGNLAVDTILKEICRCMKSVKEEDIRALSQMIAEKNRIFCDGAGRSRLQMEAFAMRLAQMGFSASAVGEVTAPPVGKNDLLIIGSASGKTGSLLEHASKAKDEGAAVAAVTADLFSPLAEKADLIVEIRASAKDRATRYSIQPMGSLFEQSLGILCDSLVLTLMEEGGITGDEMYRRHSNLE